MKLLVTGGAGFIGGNFIRYWLKNHRSDKIVNLDKLTYAGHLSSTKDFSNNSNYKFVKGDVVDVALVDKIVKDVDWIVHFAAESHNDRAILNPSIFTKTNVLGTQVLLEAARRHKTKKFHHVSTDEVFGFLPLNSKERFNEVSRYNPHSPYSASKAAADHLVRSYHDTFGLPVTITNGTNNFGSYQDPEKFIPRQVIRFLLGKKATIYGDGQYVRDWLYVEDHCRAIELVLISGKVGQTYCVGGQKKKGYNNLAVVRMILKILKLGESRIEFVKDRPGHDRRYALDWRKIKKELGWHPKYEFEEWLEKTVNWYVNNKWWWQPLWKKSESIYKNRS